MMPTTTDQRMRTCQCPARSVACGPLRARATEEGQASYDEIIEHCDGAGTPQSASWACFGGSEALSDRGLGDGPQVSTGGQLAGVTSTASREEPRDRPAGWR